MGRRRTPMTVAIALVGAGQTVPNLAVVKLGDAGEVDLFNSGGATHLAADVAGWYGTDQRAEVPASPPWPRPASSTPASAGAPAAEVGPGATLAVPVTDRGGVTTSGVSAVVLQVTATNQFVPGQRVPNLVWSRCGTRASSTLFSRGGSTHVIADVAGWHGV